MLESVCKQCRLAYDAYWQDEREQWVLRWPGQIVQTISCQTWTKEVISHTHTTTMSFRKFRVFAILLILVRFKVEDAINVGEVPEYLEQSNQQIVDIVALVRGVLSPGATITIEALVVLDVHGKLHIYALTHSYPNTLFDKMAPIKKQLSKLDTPTHIVVVICYSFECTSRYLQWGQ